MDSWDGVDDGFGILKVYKKQWCLPKKIRFPADFHPNSGVGLVF